MSLLHPCNQEDWSKVRDRDAFCAFAMGPLAKHGHAQAAVQALALIIQNEQPLRMILEDWILPCYQDLVDHDESVWNEIRGYLIEHGGFLRSDLESLVPGVVGPHVGRALNGASSLDYISHKNRKKNRVKPKHETTATYEKVMHGPGSESEDGLSLNRWKNYAASVAGTGSENELETSEDDRDFEDDGEEDEDDFVVDDDVVEYVSSLSES